MTYNAFRDHIKKQVNRRLHEFPDGIDIDDTVDRVEEYANEIADDLRKFGGYRDYRGHLWMPCDVAEEIDEVPALDITLLTKMNNVFGDLIKNPGCLAVAIETASPDNRVILEGLRDLVHGCLGLFCGDLAIEKIHNERDEAEENQQ